MISRRTFIKGTAATVAVGVSVASLLNRGKYIVEGVITNAELIEHPFAGPDGTFHNYTYSANFEMALPDGKIERLWINGEEIRGAVNMIKCQPRCVEFRGLPLRSYGNRIPKVTAEILT